MEESTFLVLESDTLHKVRKHLGSPASNGELTQTTHADTKEANKQPGFLPTISNH